MNNADSFAIAFDETWKNSIKEAEESTLNQEQKINFALSKIENHPFVINSPLKAREIARFRIRLLNLK